MHWQELVVRQTAIAYSRSPYYHTLTKHYWLILFLFAPEGPKNIQIRLATLINMIRPKRLKCSNIHVLLPRRCYTRSDLSLQPW